MKRNKGLGFIYQPRYRDRRVICNAVNCSHAYDEQRCEQIKVSRLWWVSYSYRGRKIRLSSNSAKRGDAVRLLKAKLAEVGSGRPVIADAERTTFEDLVTILVDNYKANRRRSLDKLLSRLRHLRAFFGFDREIEIAADRLDGYVAQRLAEAPGIPRSIGS